MTAPALAHAAILDLRLPVLDDHSQELVRVEREIRLAPIVSATDEYLAWLYPGVTLEQIATEWHDAGVSCCIITYDGARGAYLMAPNRVAYRRTAHRAVNASVTDGIVEALGRPGALGDDPVSRLSAVTSQEWLYILHTVFT